MSSSTARSSAPSPERCAARRSGEPRHCSRLWKTATSIFTGSNKTLLVVSGFVYEMASRLAWSAWGVGVRCEIEQDRVGRQTADGHLLPAAQVFGDVRMRRGQPGPDRRDEVGGAE